MRSKTSGIGAPGSQGYALTSRKAFANIVRGLHFSEEDAFIDIGCGKGGVLYAATDWPFGTISGIEIEPWLVARARQNMAALKLDDRVNVLLADAVSFADYGQYNVFFLFNPFEHSIYDSVIRQIIDSVPQQASRPIRLICYGAHSDREILGSGFFSLERVDRCPYRGNDIHIYRWEG